MYHCGDSQTIERDVAKMSKTKLFIELHTNKHKCICGCERYIKPARQHMYKGIPKYIKGHQLNIQNPNSDGHINKGRTFTEEHIQHMSVSRIGKRMGTNSPVWKGGKKLSITRQNYKRRNFFKYIFLNNPEQNNWVGHHIDKEYIIFIPEGLHKSIYHSITKNINMDIINDKVYEWFVGYYLNGR